LVTWHINSRTTTMIKNVLQYVAAFVLALLPFFPITENFFPPNALIDYQTFPHYILICSIVILFGLLLAFFIKAKNTNNSTAWFILAIGAVAIFPLHLGAPRENVNLLTFASIEKFRYAMLIIAVLFLAASSFKLIAPLKSNALRCITILLVIITALLNLWDNFSSYMFSHEMQNWVDEGKNADSFFPQFDFNMTWRTLARISLYLSAIILGFVAVKKILIKKWQFFTFTLFCTIGITFCLLFLLKGFDYYFPFMVPAIALAPTYWIGIAMISKKVTLPERPTD